MGNLGAQLRSFADTWRPPKKFGDEQVEAAFLTEYHGSARAFLIFGLLLALLALANGIVRAAIGFGTSSPWQTELQLTRLITALVFVGAVALLIARPGWVIARYRVVAGVILVTVCAFLICILVIHTLSGAPLSRFSYAMTLALWWIYTFTRVSLWLSSLVGVGLSVIFYTCVHSADLNAATAALDFMTFANITGWICAVQIERRERILFAQRLRLQEASTALNETTRKMDAESQLKSRLLSAVGHDMRQPLKSIGLYIAVIKPLLQRSVDRVEIEGRLDRINDCVNAAELTVDHVLELGRTQASHPFVKIGQTDLRNLADRILSVHMPIASENSVRLIVRIDRASPLIVMSDGERLWDVVSNLVSNGIKYRTRQVGKSPFIAIAIKPSLSNWRISVIDNGVGIDAKDFSLMFQPYWRAPWARTSPILAGTGMGLAVVRMTLAEMPGHELRVMSKVDKGSCFQLTIRGKRPNRDVY